MFRYLLVFLFSAFTGLAQAGDKIANAAIASAHPLATQAGYEVLAKGGNAFDAAVAVAAALGVVEPYSSGLGGGGFWLLHRARDGKDTVIDARETAPARAKASDYLDAQGRPIPGATTVGPRAAAIPGTPAALHFIARRFGSRSLAANLAPAIRLARDGFPVDARLANVSRDSAPKLARFDRTAQTFLDKGKALREGATLRQPALAETLAVLGKKGADGFYRGPIARRLIEAVQSEGGNWSGVDLAGYRLRQRVPLVLHYRGLKIVTTPLPSSGGLVLGETLHMLERFHLEGQTQATRMHLVIEAMRRAYEDRAQWMGDPAFADVPVARLLSRAYAAQRAATIDPEDASRSEAGRHSGGQGAHTTHFSVVDRAGNRVAATLTINTAFGSGFVAGDTGVLLNNEMDDFALQPGVANSYGLIGAKANAIQPGKRPLSSMMPTFIEDARGTIIAGTPGGSRIPSMMLLAALDYASQKTPDLLAIISRPRYHHQFLPDRVEIEPVGFAEDVVQDLELRGHSVQRAARPWGNMQIVYIDKRTGNATPFNDPRAALGGIAWY